MCEFAEKQGEHPELGSRKISVRKFICDHCVNKNSPARRGILAGAQHLLTPAYWGVTVKPETYGVIFVRLDPYSRLPYLQLPLLWLWLSSKNPPRVSNMPLQEWFGSKTQYKELIKNLGAAKGNRNPVSSLARTRSTTKPWPRGLYLRTPLHFEQ